jgi:predicted metalloprotease with PDZ domain
LIAIVPFALSGSKWKAETRGGTVVLLIDPAVHFDTWIGQLKVIFTHEMLHLWVPNSLQLEGDYDWFFEGFTLYVALRTALELKVINFKGFLETLAGAYDAYLSHPDDVSLIDASESRWTGGPNQVYVKGMLVAFLYDLKLRKESGGRASLADRYRELFGGRIAANANGNEAIISLLDAAPAMNGFGKLYVEKNTRLELEQLLPAYGLTLDAAGAKSQLQVSRNLSAEQKQLLRSLGYRD